jgi:hypothetical protein
MAILRPSSFFCDILIYINKTGKVMIGSLRASCGISQTCNSINSGFKLRVFNAIKDDSPATERDILMRLSLPQFNHYKASVSDVLSALVKEGKLIRLQGVYHAK